MSDIPERDNILTPGEVARIFRVTVVTVAAWADEGKLESFRTPGGQRRFRREDVDAFLAAQDSNAAAS